ncbi:MAG: ABC transporter ATP-binding protein [Eubacterium sp.]
MDNTIKLRVSNLHKTYNDKIILNDVSFDVKPGEFLSILGPSGCGKTTLLRILIGITEKDSGSIYKDGTDISDFRSDKRGMGIVFQNYALFPNMTVLQNVLYPLKINKMPKKEALILAKTTLESVGLTEHMDKRPHKLSGGQQQRVAIARTLALSPDIILFDEPMSALDASTRLTLRFELERIQKEYNITMIYITHDQEEAFSMSDRIMVMGNSAIEQLDTPFNIYHHPANAYIENFVVLHLMEKLAAFRRFTEK